MDKVKHPPAAGAESEEDESDAYRWVLRIFFEFSRIFYFTFFRAVMQIEQAMGGNYRDRARERRSKFGDDIPPGMDGASGAHHGGKSDYTLVYTFSCFFTITNNYLRVSP